MLLSICIVAVSKATGTEGSAASTSSADAVLQPVSTAAPTASSTSLGELFDSVLSV